MILSNIEYIRQKIFEISKKLGFNPSDITLVAAVKYVETELIKQAFDSGVTDFGENRVQDASSKIAFLGKTARWHMIGHLQTNKAKKAVEMFDVIQSLDSVHLAEAVNKYAAKLGKKQICLLEVNIGGEQSKFGVSPQNLGSFIKEIKNFDNIDVQGLMTIAPYFDDGEMARPYFKKMKELFDNTGPWKYLSMGMSSDFETALEEGANMIRIGTSIFGERSEK